MDYTAMKMNKLLLHTIMNNYHKYYRNRGKQMQNSTYGMCYGLNVCVRSPIHMLQS